MKKVANLIFNVLLGTAIVVYLISCLVLLVYSVLGLDLNVFGVCIDSNLATTIFVLLCFGIILLFGYTLTKSSKFDIARIYLSDKERQALYIAEKFISCNLELSVGITGTLMLRLRDYPVLREIGDLDLVVQGPIAIPKDLDLQVIGKGSDGISDKYECNGIKIDLLECTEPIEIVNGYPLGSLEKLKEAKLRYYLKNPAENMKHYYDLKMLGHDFEQVPL